MLGAYLTGNHLAPLAESIDDRQPLFSAHVHDVHGDAHNLSQCQGTPSGLGFCHGRVGGWMPARLAAASGQALLYQVGDDVVVLRVHDGKPAVLFQALQCQQHLGICQANALVGHVDFEAGHAGLNS